MWLLACKIAFEKANRQQYYFPGRTNPLQSSHLLDKLPHFLFPSWQLLFTECWEDLIVHPYYSSWTQNTVLKKAFSPHCIVHFNIMYTYRYTKLFKLNFFTKTSASEVHWSKQGEFRGQPDFSWGQRPWICPCTQQQLWDNRILIGFRKKKSVAIFAVWPAFHPLPRIKFVFTTVFM